MLFLSCQASRRQSSATTVSQSPSSVTSKLMCSIGSREIQMCGMLCGKKFGTSDTGATFIEVPMTITRSAIFASRSVRRSKKLFGSFSPKKVMSGFMIPASGISYAPSEVSVSSKSAFLCLLGLRFLDLGTVSDSRHLVQRDGFFAFTSSKIV